MTVPRHARQTSDRLDYLERADTTLERARAARRARGVADPQLNGHEDTTPLDLVLDTPVEPLPAVHVLAGEAPLPPALLVDDLLVDRDVNLLGGHGGSAKSVVLLEIAISVVLGVAVFGSLSVRRPGPVVLVAPEDGLTVVRTQLEALVVGRGLTAAQRAVLEEQLIMVPDDVSVELPRDARRLARLARDVGAVLVTLDPLANLLASGKKENDTEVPTEFCNALRRHVCWDAGAAVAMTHHLRKPAKENGPDSGSTAHDVRGGGGWVNSARAVWGVSKKEDTITLQGLKTNRIRPDLRHELELRIEASPSNKAHWTSCCLTDANAGARSESFTPGKGRELNANERAALSALDDRHEPGARLSYSRWLDSSGLSPSTFKEVRGRLLDAELAIAVATGKNARNGSPEYVYGITDPGRDILNRAGKSDRAGIGTGKGRDRAGFVPSSPLGEGTIPVATIGPDS